MAEVLLQLSPYPHFICPMDGLPLQERERSLVCEKNHAFDRASEGYWNLLLVQQKASLDPGDSKEMVQARYDFLQAGYYVPIAESIFSFVQKIVLEEKKSTLCLADAGCGEGYYLREVQRLAKELHSSTMLETVGFDISKWAVKAAAKKSKELSWCVASNRAIPFQEKSINILLSMFGFPIWESFQKILAQEARVILVDPAPEHLLSLREIIYPSVEKNAPPSIAEAEKLGFALEEEKSLRFEISIKDKKQIQNLLAMTPHAHRLSAQGSEALSKLEELHTGVDLIFRVLKAPKRALP